MLKQVEEIEYHIYEVIGDDKQEQFVVFTKEEADYWKSEGKVIYEWRRFATQSEWLTTFHQVVYEWH